MPTPIAVQLYSLRDAMQHNPAAVIARLAAAGYDGIEPYAGVDPKLVAQLGRQHNLQISSAHLPIPHGASEHAALTAAEALGITRMVVPWLPAEEFHSLDSIRHVCDTLNAASEIARRHGYTLAYHNHWWELHHVQGRSALDIMADHLAPEVTFEVDTYWVKVGGGDPAAVVSKLGARAPLLHLKDGPATDHDAPMVAVGDGALDFPAILAAAQADWLIVELDRCATDMMTAVERSRTYLSQIVK